VVRSVDGSRRAAMTLLNRYLTSPWRDGQFGRLLRVNADAWVLEICGDQLCIVVHREAFDCNGRLGN